MDAQVGVILGGLMIEAIEMGGPAFVQGKLKTGDSIVSIDGIIVTAQNASEELLGCDMPGTHVSITFKSGHGVISLRNFELEPPL